MKKILFVLGVLTFSLTTFAQTTYTINNEEISLYKEAEGDLTLLWNVFDNRYRYFVTKNNKTYELTNIRRDNGKKYQEEYKEILDKLTPETDVSTKNVNLTLKSLSTFVNKHNSLIDKSYITTNSEVNAKARFGVFGGVTNAVYSTNPTNERTAVIGAELELYSSKKLDRHSLFAQVRHVLETDKFDYNYTGLSLNYRFKLINAEWFHFYAEAEFAEIYYTEEPRYLYEENSDIISSVERRNDFSLDIPLSLGVGMAIRIGKEAFFTLSYNDFVALGKDDNGEFPIDFTAGLKFNL